MSLGSAIRFPARLAPLYRGQLLVHGIGFSPDHRTMTVVSIGSNSITFIATVTNKVSPFSPNLAVRQDEQESG